jgi:hypothetical protein
MTQAEWLEKTMADRPPLTRAQVAVLRPILAPTAPHTGTAPATNDEGCTRTPHERKPRNAQQ